MFPRSHIHRTHELKQQNRTFMIIGMDNEGFTIINFPKRYIFNNPHLQNVKANITGINSKTFNGQNKNSYKSYFNQDM